MRLSRLLLGHFSLILPPLMAKSLYLLIFYLVKVLFPCNHYTLTYRNGLFDGRIIWGISDIDLTLTGMTVEPATLSKIIQRYQLLKRIIPIIGEMNIIHADTVKNFLPCANLIGLSRDPSIKTPPAGADSITTELDSLIFLMRSFQANRQQLSIYPHFSMIKWDHYFKLCHIRKLSSTSVLDSLCASVPLLHSLEYSTFLARYNPTSAHDINHFYSTQNFKIPMMTLFPAQWLGASYLHKKVDEDIKALTHSSTVLIRLFLRGIEWEIWGLYTQLWIHREESVYAHIKNIIFVLTQLNATLDDNDILRTIEASTLLLGLLPDATQK